MTDPTAAMHVHTTPDGHHYLVDGPEETCPAAEHVKVGADDRGRTSGTARVAGRRRAPAVVEIATIALVTYAAVLGLIRIGSAVLGDGKK
ncbi:hypothetical protein ATJ97_3626 [Georgenia soli]|uniref:Uncharacterized protein n=1 Tax=Georgenia soli TaxID=638953 RepID=A0A2A9ES38_9MICO|nr:hypothetical protein [Georgenia soli]PFG41080.1 hypothetical protein ATJ97_3626 [Georgenia soli]